ncbi:MAG TPA: S41 family peptidase [Nannocystis sp.]|jgi:carboxyl-terminal processing protease
MPRASRLLTSARLRAAALLLTGMAFGAGLMLLRGAEAGPAEQVKPAPLDYSRYRKLDLFARSLAIVEQHYVRPVDGERMIYAAITGLVSELDPHSEFLPPQDAKLLREDIEGSFGGIGTVIVLRQETQAPARVVLEVREVIAGGPAARAGVKIGDYITEIEGKPIGHFFDMRRALSAMRGPPGSKVSFTLETPQAKGKPVVRPLTVTREFIDSPAVIPAYLGEGMAHVRLRDFSETSAHELSEAIAKMREAAGKAGLQGVVLDLRDNGGGLLDQAVRVVDLFVDAGPIVRTRGRMGNLLDESRALPGGPWNKVPLAVIINKASASASEVVAGALQDHHRALIVGERSYGKGSVQAPFELGDGSVLKLTISLYYTPADRLIQASGILPDVLVGTDMAEYKDSLPELEPERAQPRHLRPEAFGHPASTQGDESEAVRAAGTDAQLRAAVQHLRSHIYLQSRTTPRSPRRG